MKKTISEAEGQRIWGPLWTLANLYNHGPNAGLPSVIRPLPTTARGRRRKEGQ